MGQIISGAELGSYKTVAIQLGQARKENRQGIKSKYILLTLKDSFSLMSKSVRRVIFEDQISGLHEILAKYAASTPDTQGMYPVDLKAFKASEDFNDWKELMLWPGGMVMQYKLRKGRCYANTLDGERVLDGRGNPVIKDTVSVFVQVRQIIPNETGGSTTVFVDGLSLDEEGQRMESRFYSETVEPSDSDPLAGIIGSAPAQNPAPQPNPDPSPNQAGRPF